MGGIKERPSRNMYQGHMDKAKRGKFEGRGQGWVGQGGHGGGTETTVLEQQQQNYFKKI